MNFLFRCTLLLTTAVLFINAPPAMAEQESYCYVTAYSYNLKVAYHTPIFTRISKGKSFTDEQYVADMKQIRKLEDALQTHLRNKYNINPSFFVFSARTGFKSELIAERHLNLELVDLTSKGLKVQVVTDLKAD